MTAGQDLHEPSFDVELDAESERAAIARFGAYEILGRLAVGGMAEIFLARERGEGESVRHVALKVLRPEHAHRPDLAALFFQEGKVALGLGHPNLCHTLRFGTEQGHAFLALEHVDGVTLRDVYTHARRAGTTVSAPVAAKIVSSVAEALHSAHAARDASGRPLGIVHQDVSPQNVMVAHDGTVKLLDFGVASTARERATEAIETSHVTVRGKTAYLSPEQCSGVPLDPRSDVFSLGVVLYELLTTTRLFARGRAEDSMRAIAIEPLPAWPASIPPPLCAVLDRALAHDRDARYPSAGAMQEDLERWLADGRWGVTSSRIAEEMARVLGDDHGRPPTLDTSPEVTAWLRSELETGVVTLPRPVSRARRVPRGLLALAAIALVAIGIGAAMSRAEPPPAVEAAARAPAPSTTPSITPSLSPSPSPSTASAPAPAPASARAPAPAPRPPRRRFARPATPAEDAPTDFIDDPGY